MLRIIDGFRIRGYIAGGHTEKKRKAFPVCKEPGLNHPHRDSETHVGCRIW
jgi:hypothetical protein